MVIGNGMLANAFSSYVADDDVVIFASGVSNSKTENLSDLEREVNLINKVKFEMSSESYFIYFSTVSIEDPDLFNTHYVIHKKNVENLIKDNFKNYIIFRLTNVVGKTNNQNTVFNFLKSRIESGKAFELWKNATRNLIDIDQLTQVVGIFLKNKIVWNTQTINIGSPDNIKAIDLLSSLELYMNKKANVTLVNRGATVAIDLKVMKEQIQNHFETFQFHSIQTIIAKYA